MVRENIVIGVGADISVYERQMARLTAGTGQGFGEAARQAETASGRMAAAHEEAYGRIQALSTETRAVQETGLEDYYERTVRVTEDVDRLRQTGLQDHVSVERRKLAASEEFLSGVRSGYEDLQGRLTDWADGGERVFRTFVSQSATFFEDGLFSVIKGRFDDIEDAWQNLVDSMLRSFLGFIGELAAQNLAQIVAGSLTGGGLLSGLGLSTGGGGLISGAINLIESGGELISGAVEAVGGLFGGLFDRLPDPDGRPATVYGGAVPTVRDASPKGVDGCGGFQRVEVHIHGDTLSDPQTLYRVAAKVGEALSRRRELFVYQAE